MRAGRFKPLVWPVALLSAAVIVGGLAELSVRSLATAGLYGMLKIVSDMTVVIALIWGVVAVFRVFKPAAPRA